MKGKVSLVIGLLGFIVSVFVNESDIKSTVFKVSLGFVLGAIIDFIVFMIENRKNLKLFKTKFIKWNKPIRVTVAYLFRIEVNGRYALIKRHKKDRIGYQPIGGAYKYFKEENRELFNELGIEPCNYVKRDSVTKDDLRIRINKRKNLIKFLKWFESRKNREVDPWREFYEELVYPGLLPPEKFSHVKYAFIGSHKEIESPSPVFPIDEFRYADIYELRPDSDAQKQAIEDLINSQEIIFATPNEIRNGATEDGKTILPHTFKILPK
ncbi:MAG: hypothetical protein KDC47_06490 [Flavobacteriaceae bacterium]|nr:hypothetical protein [Flavobacteriaceae bacterium]